MSYRVQRESVFERLDQIGQSVLDPLQGAIADSLTLATANEFLNAEFRKLEETGVLLVVQNGLKVTGLKATYDPGDPRRMLLTMQLAFYPGPRFANQAGDVIPLGFFEEYDLYIGLQTGLPATLIARYGNKGPFYSTLNPHLVEIDPDNTDHEPFVEAYHRALELRQMQISPVQKKGYFGIAQFSNR